MKRFALFLFVFASLTVGAFGQAQEKEQDDARSLARACSLTLDVNAYHPRKVQGEREAFDLGFCLGFIRRHSRAAQVVIFVLLVSFR